MRYFRGAFAFAALCLILAALLGYSLSGTLGGVISTVFICTVLGVLEISLSFDNAVVNASVLQKMGVLWRRRFLLWGILIAVFGMRLLFPLLIVGFVAHLGLIAALDLALHYPADYARILSSSHTQIMGFGGSFLAMVALAYFLDEKKEVHWLGMVERSLMCLSRWKDVGIAIVLFALLSMTHFLPSAQAIAFLVSGLWGIISYIVVKTLGQILDNTKQTTTMVAKAGLGSFLYLEVVDSSFSFDSVICSFALSTKIFVIALGLGIGAMFVRSLTVMLVDTGSLVVYRYLEHGAFWAIFVLSVLMFVSVCHDVPDVVTGMLGACFIGAAFISSILWNKRHPEKNCSGFIRDRHGFLR